MARQTLQSRTKQRQIDSAAPLVIGVIVALLLVTLVGMAVRSAVDEVKQQFEQVQTR